MPRNSSTMKTKSGTTSPPPKRQCKSKKHADGQAENGDVEYSDETSNHGGNPQTHNNQGQNSGPKLTQALINTLKSQHDMLKQLVEAIEESHPGGTFDQTNDTDTRPIPEGILQDKPASVSKPFNDLVASIPSNIRNEIWAGGFFDLTKLFQTTKPATHRVVVNLTGDMPGFDIHKAAPPKYTLKQWREAFTKYAVCLCHQDPFISSDLLAYIISIEEMEVDLKNSQAWSFYDVEFRHKRAANNWQWTHYDQRCYSKAISKFLSSSESIRASTVPTRGSTLGQLSEDENTHCGLVPNGYCRKFAINQCTRSDNVCKFEHKCYICRSRHPSISCDNEEPT